MTLQGESLGSSSDSVISVFLWSKVVGHVSWSGIGATRPSAIALVLIVNDVPVSIWFLLACSATRGTEFPSDSLAFLDREDAINSGQLDTFFSA